MGSTPPPLVRIAIIGGGIAGLALAAGLSRHPHIDAHVYESVPAYADVGAGLALHRNALAAMALIHPDVPSMYFARALSMGREEHEEMVTEVRLAHGPHAGDLVAELGRARGRKTIARAELLRGLRGLVPDGRLHLGKRLRGLEQGARGAVKVSFEDGEELCVDGVVGADGLRSATRSYILGPDHPAAPPRNPEGWQIYRRMMTMEQARAEGIAEKWTRDVGIFMGPKGHLNALPLDKGTKLNIGIAVRGAKVGVDGKPAALDVRDYEDYSDEARGLVRMVAKDVNMMWTAADHDPAPTFCRGRVCMIGDAAASMHGFAGQGAAQALESCAVLTHLFSRVEGPEQIEAAFQAYDAARRPRSQAVVELTRRYGRVYAYAEPDVGHDLAKIRAFFQEAAAFTNDADLERQNRDAMAFYESYLPKI